MRTVNPFHTLRRRHVGVVAIAAVSLFGLTGCPQSPGSGPTTATVYRSLVPYTGLGGTAELIGSTTMSHVAVGSSPAGVYPVRDSSGNIIGVTAGCLSGAIGNGGSMSMCFDGPTPGADFVFGTGGTLVVTSQASPTAPVMVDTTSEPAPVPTGGLFTYLFQTYVHTSCSTNAPSFPSGSCYGASFTISFGNAPIGI